MVEGYPPTWWHATIHLDPKTGAMHSDGDHRVRHYVQAQLASFAAENARLKAVLEDVHALRLSATGVANPRGDGLTPRDVFRRVAEVLEAKADG